MRPRQATIQSSKSRNSKTFTSSRPTKWRASRSAWRCPTLWAASLQLEAGNRWLKASGAKTASTNRKFCKTAALCRRPSVRTSRKILSTIKRLPRRPPSGSALTKCSLLPWTMVNRAKRNSISLLGQLIRLPPPLTRSQYGTPLITRRERASYSLRRLL